MGGYAPQPPYPPQGGYAAPQMYPPQYAGKKKRTGLIVGICVGAFLIVAAAIALWVWPNFLGQQTPGVNGYWYSDDRAEALEFKSSGSIHIYTKYEDYEGQYEFESAKGMGVITMYDMDYEFAITDDGLKVKGMGTYERAQADFDVDDYLNDMSPDIQEESAIPLPTEEVVSELPSEAPSETIAVGSAQAGDIVGLWYETTGYGGTLEFYSDGTYEMAMMNFVFGGTYEYDSVSASWLLYEDSTGTTYTLTLTDGTINVNTMTYTREVVEQFDWNSVEN